MTEERKYAILFAAKLLCARKLIEVGFGQTESSYVVTAGRVSVGGQALVPRYFLTYKSCATRLRRILRNQRREPPKRLPLAGELVKRLWQECEAASGR